MRRLVLYFVSGVKSKAFFRILARYLYSPFFVMKYRRYRTEKKIIYVLTPPSQLSNIGDHAQATSILNWIYTHFAGLKVIELDKDMTYYLLDALKRITNDKDIILIHSGGNMGDVSLWSEEARRKIVESFPTNKIISLPQTIFFNDTEKGKKELLRSSEVYNGHSDLTIYGRDKESYLFASEKFRKAKVFAAPDFVLRYPYRSITHTIDKTLLCLRHDSESVFMDKHDTIRKMVGGDIEFFDTTLPFLISKKKREKILKQTLDYFNTFNVIVTDRYHGLIFSILVKKPCVVLPTFNHKLTSALNDWFSELDYVFFAENENAIPASIQKARKAKRLTGVNWDEKYFNIIAKRILDEDNE